MTPENKAKNKVVGLFKRLRLEGAPIKWVGMAGSQFGQADVDFTVCLCGQYVSIEVKRFDGKGKVSGRQLLALSDTEAAGGKSYLLESEENLAAMELDFRAIINKYEVLK
jgi:hypothetical protein